jgi:hypothetical protein
MPLRLEPMGNLVVYIDESWNFMNGPVSGRSCSSFREVVWESPRLRARSVWGNGSYQNGPDVAEPNIRVMFRADDGSLLYLDYLVRVHLPTHTLPVGSPDKSPAIMSGRLEVDESNSKYAWLNRTQVVGMGTLDLVAKTQSYDMCVLRWHGDTGPAD